VNGAHTDPDKVIQLAQSVPLSPSALVSFKSVAAQAKTKLLSASQMVEVSAQ
jgi:hypothetical protein